MVKKRRYIDYSKECQFSTYFVIEISKGENKERDPIILGSGLLFYTLVQTLRTEEGQGNAATIISDKGGGRVNGGADESMLDIYIYETTQNVEQLEELVLAGERAGGFSPGAVDEVFRIMHTIKGSSAMMCFNGVAALSHALEDLFGFLRERRAEGVDYRRLSDLILESMDVIRKEMEKTRGEAPSEESPPHLTERIHSFLRKLQEIGVREGKNGDAPAACLAPAEEESLIGGKVEGPDAKNYEAVIYFMDGCEMENIRAFAILHNLREIAEIRSFFPEDIVDNRGSAQVIREQGFRISFRSEKSLRELNDFLAGTPAVRDLELAEIEPDSRQAQPPENGILPDEGRKLPDGVPADIGPGDGRDLRQSIVSVDVAKLDRLMDLMGEMVIAEAMVTQNPELATARLNTFYKAARRLQKITGEMQDMVMSIRMVPLSATFHKMQRIVRDMSRKLDKEVELRLVGEETEVDKNIIEHISDPLMHLVRNSIDHGIEPPDVRTAAGKSGTGHVILEAANAGNNVLIIVRDDGRGLDRAGILKKAAQQGLLTKPENEMTDKEVYSLIFRPGFSTKEAVTEFSGRGVGMDVVTKKLEAIGGTVSVESEKDRGTVTTLKIPLTLAIIDGMNIRVGDMKYTLPTTSIQETFQAKAEDLVRDPDGNEMILVRGACYPVLRLHERFYVQTEITDLTKGIMLMVEQDGRTRCLFADELIGQHQVVVKALPTYMKNIRKVEGLAGCTLLGDGSISLILNIGGLMDL